MAPHKSMRTKTWSLERTTFPVKFGQNGRCARAHSPPKGHVSLEPRQIWSVESTKGIVYGLLDFSKPTYYFT